MLREESERRLKEEELELRRVEIKKNKAIENGENGAGSQVEDGKNRAGSQVKSGRGSELKFSCL